MKFMLITNHPDIARHAVNCGVDRIFVDLEIHGKEARQGHLSTVISRHQMRDVETVRRAVPTAELLVRLNPLHEGSAVEVDEAIAAGADLLMLPMFRGRDDVSAFCALVRGRARVVLLLETAEAMHSIREWVGVPGISEVYIGLNDLHLATGLAFMFEPLALGWVDRMAAVIKEAGLPFGFGGVARVGEGLLPGEKVIAEHMRLGSTSVILSRTFHRQAATLDELCQEIDMAQELEKLRAAEKSARLRSMEEQEAERQEIAMLIERIAAARRGGGSS